LRKLPDTRFIPKESAPIRAYGELSLFAFGAFLYKDKGQEFRVESSYQVLSTSTNPLELILSSGLKAIKTYKELKAYKIRQKR